MGVSYFPKDPLLQKLCNRPVLWPSSLGVFNAGHTGTNDNAFISTATLHSKRGVSIVIARLSCTQNFSAFANFLKLALHLQSKPKYRDFSKNILIKVPKKIYEYQVKVNMLDKPCNGLVYVPLELLQTDRFHHRYCTYVFLILHCSESGSSCGSLVQFLFWSFHYSMRNASSPERRNTNVNWSSNFDG